MILVRRPAHSVLSGFHTLLDSWSESARDGSVRGDWLVAGSLTVSAWNSTLSVGGRKTEVRPVECPGREAWMVSSRRKPQQTSDRSTAEPEADRRCVRCHCQGSDGAEIVGWRQAHLEGRPISWLCPDCATFVSSIVPASSRFWAAGSADGGRDDA
jgi:hypothetical protein